MGPFGNKDQTCVTQTVIIEPHPNVVHFPQAEVEESAGLSGPWHEHRLSARALRGKASPERRDQMYQA